MTVTEPMVYLDHNATTPMRPAVRDVLYARLAQPANASSVHRHGREARKVIEQARADVAALTGVPANWVVFTSGGTEANNLALSANGVSALVVSAVEHDSVLAPARAMAHARETETVLIPVSGEGVVDLAGLEDILAQVNGRALVSVMLDNNETGTVQPLTEVSRIARHHGALVHGDAVQAAGKRSVDMTALGLDMMTLSAHKMGGPQGVGALIADPAIGFARRLLGGGQEFGRRAGTENVASIAAFGQACRLAVQEPVDWPRIARLRDGLERRITEQAPDARIFAAGGDRLPNTTSLAMPGVGSETQVMALDLDGISISAGSACSSGKVTPSHVLQAMGIDEAEAKTAIRISLGWTSTETDIDTFVDAWLRIYERTRQKELIAEPAA
jgi:cysteine desulfurase